MRFLLLLPTLFLSACAFATQVGPAAQDRTPTIIGEGAVPSNEILIYRAGEVGLITNVATTPAILLDGRAIGTCRIGHPLVLKVPSGTWEITALTQNGKVVQEVTVGEGDRANLRCGTSSAPSLSPAPTLARVDAATADRESGL
ncbi:MAG: hypothetical protein HKM96_09805 [Boseongicola sp.]|nr:hypothetical protein [Boseongicola sp.]